MCATRRCSAWMVSSAHLIPISRTPAAHPRDGGFVAGVAYVTDVKVAGAAFDDFLNNG